MIDKEYYKKWWEANKEDQQLKAKEKYKKNRVSMKMKVLERRYAKLGFSMKQKKVLYKLQGGRCEICNNKIPLTSSCLDHCHKTNKVRGILCDSCNLGLGKLKDDINIAINSVFYLKKYE